MSEKVESTAIVAQEGAGLPQILSDAQRTFLLQRTPRKEVEFKPGRGGKQQAYVTHSYVTELLNNVFGFLWNFEVVDKQIYDDEVMVQVRLTVITPAGEKIVKEQFGGADIERYTSGGKSGKPLSIADNLKAASSDGLKKCASLLGIGLDLYGRDYTVSPGDEKVGSQPSAQAPKRAPVQSKQQPQVIEGEARPVSDRATREQIKAIRTLAGDVGMPLVDMCRQLGIETLEALSESKARKVIARLGEMKQFEEHQAKTEAAKAAKPAKPAGEVEDPDRAAHVRLIYDHGKRIKMQDALECQLVIRAIANGAEMDSLNPTALEHAAVQFTKFKSRDDALAWADARLNPPKEGEKDGLFPDDGEGHQQQPDNVAPFPNPDQAAVTAAQLKAIYTIGRAARHLSESQVEDRCAEVFGCRPSELTKAEASQFIDSLKQQSA